MIKIYNEVVALINSRNTEPRVFAGNRDRQLEGTRLNYVHSPE